MQSKKRNRLLGIITMLTVCALGTYIILSNLNDNIVFFYPPSELTKIKSNTEKVRVGGLVKNDSIEIDSSGKVLFIITDNIADLQIEYHGILPALFREKQGIVAEGVLLSNNLFKASKLLAKHDENYRPPELRHINTN
ncbi:MAG: cytochrome c maturation protein CcmE [Rickettsiaceae bacterium]|nr:cytochrome c maturation protein CcmE [Rickettsiaceae bacterium]MDP4832736.1 cytochrome c maturation protein CcmE [Rickettsiaceae bacterium]MDP5020496.1 cytochrome c maturation protein CcmE [Rickettsiaceae bacterium]MDP5083669.1 cytochrome c maturation protein CcmE [Rickettsiaceae bacterium]